jgi:hypothetical protein
MPDNVGVIIARKLLQGNAQHRLSAGVGLRRRVTRGGLGERLANSRRDTTERAEGPSSSGPAKGADRLLNARPGHEPVAGS